MQVKLDNDIAKEVLMVLAFSDSEITNKIPTEEYNKLLNLAADSKKDVYLDKDKSLNDLNISEDAKNYLSILYEKYLNEDNNK